MGGNRLLYRGILMALLGALLGCGSSTKTQVYMVDEELSEYLEEFKEQAASRGVELYTGNLMMYFSPNMRPGRAGMCYRGTSGSRLKGRLRRIVINRTAWEARGPYSKQFIAIHELGHCLIKRGHTKQGDMSFMQPMVRGESFTEENWAELWDEMFRKILL